MPESIKNGSVQIELYHYWYKKEKFMLYEDAYSNWTLFAPEEGSFYFEIGDGKGIATFGDLVICPPNVPFKRVVVSPLSFYLVNFHWGDAVLEQSDTPISGGRLTMEQTERLASNYSLLKNVNCCRPSFREQVKLHCLEDICLHAFMLHELNKNPVRRANHEASDPLMAEAAMYLRNQAADSVNFKDLATSLGISPVQLTRKFTAAYGQTPRDYLTRIRVEKAKKLLLETRLTIDQIAECCGYPTGFYLHRVFLKYVQMSPSHFRKKYLV